MTLRDLLTGNKDVAKVANAENVYFCDKNFAKAKVANVAKVEQTEGHPLVALAPLALATPRDPTKPCETCGSGQYWQLPGEPWHCWQCEPNKPLTATTLTLTCHPPAATPTGAQAFSDAVLGAVCKNLNITPAQLREELADDDLSELSPKALRQVARTLADARPPQNQAINMLRQHPELTHAFATNDDDDPDYVIVTVGVRDKGTVDLRIAKDKYDSLELLQIIEEHTSGDLT